ncbi:glycosyltransferase [Staphylococcus gallinarum]|uniref:Glycosyltransferase n=1 Tax=Staphylococcus gallinarum TaxID=1293 RepID=A0A380FLE5_STAGA|nr:glycosyltransferase [Staphylococcus gallinarum]
MVAEFQNQCSLKQRLMVAIEDSRIIYTLSPTKFYRTALLRTHDIYFPEHIRSAEDQIFTMQAYVNAQKIGCVSR